NLILITIALFFSVNFIYKILVAKITPASDFFALSAPQSIVKGEKSLSRAKVYPGDHYQKIIKRNFFNVKIKDTDIKEDDLSGIDIEALEKLEKTDLDLKLWGTVTGDKKQAFAVIEEKKNRKQLLYQKGDTIQSAVVKTILRNRVILNYNGKDQILEMDIKNKNKNNRIRSVLKNTSVESSNNITIKRSVVDESISNINNLMKQVRVRPHFANGKPDGLLLYGIKHNSLFQEMGLKNGDIIMGVDGKEIESVDDALTLYQNLKNSSNVNLQIKRRGKRKEINYNVQ
ncbi:MAG: type II secretion system protein GspC, partial [Thermodesulfobacteriota bacterium]|nr:type II secretion system protein GspC [Thermodesulfobacteriota bacterium]